MEEEMSLSEVSPQQSEKDTEKMPIVLEGVGTSLGAIPKQSYSSNPKGAFSKLALSLGFKSKRDDQNQENASVKKEKKEKKRKDKKKKGNAKSKLKTDEPDGEVSFLLANDQPTSESETEARNLPAKGTFLPEKRFSFQPKLKRETSKSKFAATIARKMSLGILRKEKAEQNIYEELPRPAAPRASPATSNDDVDLDFVSGGSKESPIRGAHGPKASSFTRGFSVEHEDFVGFSSFNTFPDADDGPVEEVSIDSMETTSSQVIESLEDASLDPDILSQLNVEGIDTPSNLHQPDNNNKSVLACDKSEITQVEYLAKTVMNLDPPAENTLLQSGQTSVEEGGGESGSVSQNSGGQVSQLEASRDLRNTGKAFEREPSIQNPCDNRAVEFEYDKKPQENVSALFKEDAFDSSDGVSDQLVPDTVAASQDPHEPYFEDRGTAAIDLIQSGHNKGHSELDLTDEQYAVVTSILSKAWMSLRKGDEASLPQQPDEVPGSQAKKSKAKGKKVKTSTPITPVAEQKKEEADKEQEAKEKRSESPPSDTWSPGQMLESVPGSSKSEAFFTPKDSPTGMSSLEADNSQDTQFFSANVTVETPENYMSPKVDTSLSNGEDVMAEARARLSQSLGIANATATQHQVGDKREHLYKILVIGELGTGKTSIIKRYVHQFFSQHYRATIGVDFALKVLNWDANTIIRLQLWDIAGQERFGNMTRVYYKEAVGAFIVFDVTRAATFDAVVKWKQDLDSKVQLPDGSPIPCVLLANKCDQQKEGLVNQPPKMEEYCKERGFSGWFETSAKENINIEEAARALVTKILQNDQLRTQPDLVKDGEKFNLDGNNLQDDKAKSKCSC